MHFSPFPKRVMFVVGAVLFSISLIGVVFFLLIATTRHASAFTPTIIRIDAGAMTAYTGVDGKVWSLDQYFVGGGRRNDPNTLQIANTDDDPLYRTDRHGLNGYAIPVPNGTYQVTLYFAETADWVNGPDQRVFDVTLEGTTVLSNFDVFAQAGGKYSAITKTFTVAVSDGKMSIGFLSKKGTPFIKAIEVIGIAPASVSINASPASIQLGGTSTLTWNAAGATSCSQSNGWNGVVATSGLQVVSPATTTTYTVTCTSPSGSDTESAVVTVVPAVIQPTVSISAEPNSIAPGANSTLSWEASNANTCMGVSGISGPLPLLGNQVVTPATTTTYAITCTGTGGAAITATSTITIQDPQEIISLIATPGASAVNLSWNVSTPTTLFRYIIERCNGALCTSFASIGSTTAQSFSDQNANTNTLYRYRVSAFDLSGTVLGHSNITEATITTIGILKAYPEANDPIGQRYASEKVPYTDKAQNRQGYRLTNIGKKLNLNFGLGHVGSVDSTQWSPDSSKITYTMQLSSTTLGVASTTGVYMLDVQSGVITLLAKYANGRGSAFNKGNPNEILYWKVVPGAFQLTAVNINDFTERNIIQLPEATDASTPSQSYDASGRWIESWVVGRGGAGLAGPRQGGEDNRLVQTIVVDTMPGGKPGQAQFHPGFPYVPNITFTLADSGHDLYRDGAMWNPVFTSKADIDQRSPLSDLTTTGLHEVLFDFATGNSAPFKWPAHASWSADGKYWMSDFGIKDINGRCLNANGQCLTKGDGGIYTVNTIFGRVEPAERTRGLDQRGVTHPYNGRIQEMTVRQIANVPNANWVNNSKYTIGYTFGTEIPLDSGTRLQYSPDGKWVLWRSNLRATNFQTPPGPDDGINTTTDLFILDTNR
jgi:hypothetical protein